MIQILTLIYYILVVSFLIASIGVISILLLDMIKDLRKNKNMRINKWCERQIVTQEGIILCSARLVDGKVLKCPYSRANAYYPCIDYKKKKFNKLEAIEESIMDSYYMREGEENEEK